MVELHSNELEISPLLSFEDCQQDWLVIGYHHPYPNHWISSPLPICYSFAKRHHLSTFCLPAFVEGSSNLSGKVPSINFLSSGICWRFLESIRQSTLYQLFVFWHLLKVPQNLFTKVHSINFLSPYICWRRLLKLGHPWVYPSDVCFSSNTI